MNRYRHRPTHIAMRSRLKACSLVINGLIHGPGGTILKLHKYLFVTGEF